MILLLVNHLEITNIRKKIIKLYTDYSLEQKKKMLDFYEGIYFLETENISTFNVDIINKVNTMNKLINFFLFGEEKYKEKKIIGNHLLGI